MIFLVSDSKVGTPGSGGMASFNWERGVETWRSVDGWAKAGLASVEPMRIARIKDKIVKFNFDIGFGRAAGRRISTN